MCEIKRVLIFGLDGIGNSPKTVNTPNLDRIINKGLYTYNGRTEFPPISGECWGTILHGVEPSIHGLTNDIAIGQIWPNESPFPSIFKIIRDKRPDAEFASFCTWNAINTGMIEQNINVHFETGTDDNLTQIISKYIENNDPTLLFIGFDDCDHAGHDHGYFTEKYFQQIEKTDKNVGVLLDVLEKRGMIEDSLLMIVTDHGGGGVNPKDHMFDHPMDMTVFFACCGPKVPHKEIENFGIADIPSIVLSAFSIEIPSGWKGRSLYNI
ncbi:nucleotide pyrophosphatase [Tritrichomonas foetus]|uniref:Nucleotide pyrophosphatase n=1 Tax=Tritrichomonas foetus TaxID=1144522 RepID=A0A1J4K5B5_9EUKA|nr:nucleotide pyrophosphatase [Tritrichomonas foetus]|eukprot:OHT06583.1 nucleotide pyrophosphatase [Tritrichomonas foetus]